MKRFLIFCLFFVILSGCTGTSKSEHASRQEAEAFLKKEGLLAQDKRVVSAEWKEDLEQWLFVVEYPGENGKSQPGYWFVNSTATDYSGGTCQH